MAEAAVSFGVLMRESERCLERALGAPEAEVRSAATRILDDPSSWRAWEAEHAGFMHRVAGHRRRDVQVGELKLLSFQRIHRASVFEYLRDQRVRGGTRRAVIQHLHPTRDYAEALLAEHGAYLRATCSLLCMRHVGASVIADGAFEDPLARYRELHAEYLQAYFAAFVAGQGRCVDPARQRAVLPYLKAQLEEQRRRLLRLPPLQPSVVIEPWLRRRSGDTQRLPVLQPPSSGPPSP